MFEKIEHPLSPQELLEAAQPYAPNLGIATVYRTIKRFVEDGWLIAVEIPGEPPRYELAGKHHHHHFYCRTCSRVYEVPGCPSDFSEIAPTGFELDGHELVLYGTCASCLSPQVGGNEAGPVSGSEKK